MLEPLDRYILTKQAEPLVWWYENRYCRTRFNLARIPLALGLLAFLIGYMQMDDPSWVYAIGVCVGWWFFDNFLIKTELAAIKKGPLPNPWRTRSKLRIGQVMFLLVLFVLGMGAPPVTLINFASKFVAIASSFAATYILSCNPLPYDYKP